MVTSIVANSPVSQWLRGILKKTDKINLKKITKKKPTPMSEQFHNQGLTCAFSKSNRFNFLCLSIFNFEFSILIHFCFVFSELVEDVDGKGSSKASNILQCSVVLRMKSLIWQVKVLEVINDSFSDGVCRGGG